MGFVFLSSWLFGLGHPTLELAGSLVDLGLGVKVQTSERAHTNWYSLGLGILWQSGGQTLSSHHRSPGLTPIREPRLCKLHVVTRKKKVNNIYKQTKIYIKNLTFGAVHYHYVINYYFVILYLYFKNKMYVMEIKTLGSYPMYLVHILNKNKIYPTSFSKYGNIYTKELEEERLYV